MKITLDIPNEHAPRLLALLADLMPVRLEPQADPAEGHPELPLAMPVAKWAEKAIAESTAGTVDPQLCRAFMAGAQADDESEEIAETRWAPIEGIDAADSMKVEMEYWTVTPPKSFENASTVPPVVGERFWMRNGEVVKVKARSATITHPPSQFSAVTDEGTWYYFDQEGRNCVNKCFDLVQQCPF